MARIGRHVRVTGRVQDVFFRQWSCEQARQLGVTGWVRNCADGSVEAHLSGEEDAVRRLIEKMRRGPSAAQVAGLSVEDAEPEGSVRFEVRR